MTAPAPELRAVRCSGCGGTVRMVPGKRLPSCLFCGADAADLIPFDPPETVEPPEGAIPFAVSDDEARAAFRTFATSSFWYPSDLRSAKLELRHLLLPAWAWSGAVETHWTGLVSASTRSGKRPVSGHEDVFFEQILVPSSQSLRQAELASLGAYDESALAPFDPATAVEPYELSELTRSVARTRAQQEMERRHRLAIERANGLLKCRASSVVTELAGRPVLVPVFIGAYRYGSRTFRVLVNGQSGQLVGNAPISVWKVIGVILAVIALIGAVALAIGVCGGGAGLLKVLLR